MKIPPRCLLTRAPGKKNKKSGTSFVWRKIKEPSESREMHHAPGFACVIKEESSGGSAGCAGPPPPPPPPAAGAPPPHRAAAPAPRYFAGKKGRSRPRPRRGTKETAPGGAATEQNQVMDL